MTSRLSWLSATDALRLACTASQLDIFCTPSIPGGFSRLRTAWNYITTVSTTELSHKISTTVTTTELLHKIILVVFISPLQAIMSRINAFNEV